MHKKIWKKLILSKNRFFQNLLKKENLPLIILFIVFLFLRLFSSSKYYLIQGSDAARYLALAKNFPYHTLSNHQIFLLHPPLYPYAIHFMNYFFEDYKAGILVSFLSGIAIFFLIYHLAIFLFNDKKIAFFSLLLYSLSSIYIEISVNILKESFSVMLTLACIYYCLKFFKYGKRKHLIFSMVFGFMTGLATDHAILLIPALIACYIFYGTGTKKPSASMPLISVIISYSFWLLIKIYVYTHHNYYPAALDGIIVDTSKWTFRQVLSSNYFPEMGVYIPFGISFSPMHYIYTILYMLNLSIAPYPYGLTFETITKIFSLKYLPQILIYSFLILAGIYGTIKIISNTISNFFKHKKQQPYAGAALCFVLFAIFLLPLMQKFTSTRFTITSILFLFIIISYGITQILKKFKIINYYNILAAIIIIALISYLPFYYPKNDNFLFSKMKVVQPLKTAEYLESLPLDGIMTQIGYTQELNYLTTKRVMQLPTTSNFIFLAKKFNVSYFLYGELYGKFYSDPILQAEHGPIFNYDTIKYINGHEDQFKLIKVLDETYPPTDKADHIYIYQIK